MKCATLFFCLATTVSGASFSADGLVVSSTLTEATTVTIAADSPVSYDLSVELIFDLDDTEDKAFVSGFSIQNMPDLQPISRTTMTTEFVPGDFPDPGYLADVTRITTVDVDAARPITLGSLSIGYPIRDDTNGFYFDYRIGGEIQLTGLLTKSLSIDGGSPTIESNQFQTNSSDGLNNPNRIRINPDLSLSLESGTFFVSSFVEGFRFSYVVPEPSVAGFAFLILPMFARRLHWRNR